MTPHELKRVMQDNKWSGVALARALGIAPVQIAKWRAGSRSVPEHHAAKMRALAASNIILRSPDETPWRPPSTFGARRTKTGRRRDKASREQKFRTIDPAAYDASHPVPVPQSPPLDFSGIAAGLALVAKPGGLDLASDAQHHRGSNILEPDQPAPIDLADITAAFTMIAKAYSPPPDVIEPLQAASPLPRLDQLPAAVRGGFPPSRLIVTSLTDAPGSPPGQVRLRRLFQKTGGGVRRSCRGECPATPQRRQDYPCASRIMPQHHFIL